MFRVTLEDVGSNWSEKKSKWASVAATAVAATAAAAVTAAAATAAAAARAGLLRARLIDAEGAALEPLAVQGAHGLLSVGIGHLDEAEALRARCRGPR